MYKARDTEKKPKKNLPLYKSMLKVKIEELCARLSFQNKKHKESLDRAITSMKLAHSSELKAQTERYELLLEQQFVYNFNLILISQSLY